MNEERTFDRRGLRRLLGIAVPSFVIALTLGVLGAGLVPIREHGSNSFSVSAVGHQALVELLEALDIPVVRSQARSGLRAGRGGVLLILDARHDDDTTPVDLDRMREMIGHASATLLALPKWQVGVYEGRDGWARPAGRARWTAQRMLADLELRDTELDEPRSLSDKEWHTQNFGPAPLLSEAQLLTGPDLDPLIAHRDGVLAGETRFENRRVVVLSDPDLLATRGLADPGNAVLVVRLIEHLRRGGPVVIDEVLHGYAMTPSIWRAMFRPPILYLVLHGILCLLLLVWVGWRRFGPPPAPRALHPQGLRERVDQAASLLATGATTGVALAGYLEETRRAVQRHLSAFGDAGRPSAAALDRMATARGASETWTTLSRAVEQAVDNRTPSIPEAVHLARRVHGWRQEMTHDAR